MTSGGLLGASGGMRFELKPWLAAAVIASAVALVNATSEIMEAGRDGRELHPAAPFLWEFSSCALNIALAPFIGEVVRRYPPSRERIPLVVAAHLAGALAYSILHVAGMVAIRKAGYALVGSFYDFSHGALLREFFYEWRKDMVGYAVFAAIYLYFQTRDAKVAPAPTQDARIEIRDGGAAVFVPPAEVFWIEAAGNYVEVHTAARTHLVRGTLAAWEAKLAPKGFVRVHRSRIVNRARIRAIKPTAAGDLDITLDDGRALTGSRRYRAALDASAPAA